MIFNRNKREDPGPSIGSDKKHDDAIHGFHKLIQKAIDWEMLENAEYAMWLPCKDDPSFSKSGITVRWTKIYESYKYIQSYIAADLLRYLGLIEDDINRMTLPEESDTITVQTDDNEQIIISFSQEKGIRFHFSESTSYNKRLCFLDSFTTYCRAMKKLVEDNNWGLDTDHESDSWWDATIKATANIEKNGPVEGVGKIL